MTALAIGKEGGGWNRQRVSRKPLYAPILQGYHRADCSGDLAWCCLIVSHMLSANNDIYNFQSSAIARIAVNNFAELLFYDLYRHHNKEIFESRYQICMSQI